MLQTLSYAVRYNGHIKLKAFMFHNLRHNATKECHIRKVFFYLTWHSKIWKAFSLEHSWDLTICFAFASEAQMASSSLDILFQVHDLNQQRY